MKIRARLSRIGRDDYFTEPVMINVADGDIVSKNPQGVCIRIIYFLRPALDLICIHHGSITQIFRLLAIPHPIMISR